MAKLQLNLLLWQLAALALSWTFLGVHAINDPNYSGIKTKTYRRDPVVAQAFDQQQHQQQHQQQQQQQQHYHEHHQHEQQQAQYHHGHEQYAHDYHSPSAVGGERLSPNHHNPNVNLENLENDHPSGGGHYGYLESHQGPHHSQHNQHSQHSRHEAQPQEQPLYNRPSSRDRHVGHAATGLTSGGRNDGENAITELHTDCPHQFTGQLPYAYDCRRFLNCWNGHGHIQSCAAGTVFNPDTLECDRPDKVVCGTLSSLGEAAQTTAAFAGGQLAQRPRVNYRAGRLLDVTTDDVQTLCPDGVDGLQPHPDDCTKFINCANGNVHVQNCGPGTAFSVATKVCDFRHKVDCSGRDGGGFGIAVPSDAASRDTYAYDKYRHNSTASDILCPAGVSGLFVYPFDYTKFLNCRNGNTAIQNCMPHRYFSIKKGFCEVKDSVPYTDRVTYIVSEVKYEYSQTVATCPPGTDGVHLYPFDGGKYIKCLNGAIQVFSCPTESAFSISQKTCRPLSEIVANDHVKFFAEIVAMQRRYAQTGYSNAGATNPNYGYHASLNMCSHGSDGVYPNPFDCGKFLKCENGRLYVESCPSGSVFSLSLKRCELREIINAVDMVQSAVGSAQSGTSGGSSYSYTDNGNDEPYLVCPNNSDGMFLHPFDCTKYIRCQNGDVSVGSCVSGEVFSISRRKCVSRNQVEAHDRVEYVTETQHEFSTEVAHSENSQHHQLGGAACPVGYVGLYPHPNDSTKYLNCADGRPLVESCGSGKVFSVSRRFCDFERNIGVTDRITYSRGVGTTTNVYSQPQGIPHPPPYGSTNPHHGNNMAVSCEAGANGMFPHPYDCTKYLNCAHGVTHVQDCGPGTAWSKQMEVCDFKDKVDCTGRTGFGAVARPHDGPINVAPGAGEAKVACAGGLNGLYAHPFDYTKYINCHNYETTVQKCDFNSAFSISRGQCLSFEKVSSNDRVAFMNEFMTETNAMLMQRDGYVVCPAQASGFHIYPFDFAQFIRCDNGKTYIEQCPAGSSFSSSYKTCVAGGRGEALDMVGNSTATRQHYGWRTETDHSHHNRDSKTYTNAGAPPTNPIGGWRLGANSYHGGQPQQLPGQQPYNGGEYNANSHHRGHSESTGTTTGSDRWTNMNMPRPDATAYGQGGAWSSQQQPPHRHEGPSPTWSGTGTSVYRTEPTRTVVYEEGSLQPNRNYANTVKKTYSAPLAPFSPETTATATTTATTTTATAYNNTNVYYAQPVANRGDDRRVPSSHIAAPPPTQYAPNHRRQNHSREISYSSAGNQWTPLYTSPAQPNALPYPHPHVHAHAHAHPYPIPNQNIMPPFSSEPNTHTDNYPDDNPKPVHVPVGHLMPPVLADPGQRPQDLSDYEPATAGEPFGSQPDQFASETTGSSTGAWSVDASNLYGGMLPPLPQVPAPSVPATPTLQTSTFLRPSTRPNYPTTTQHRGYSDNNPVARPTVADETNIFGGLQPPPRPSPLPTASSATTRLSPTLNPSPYIATPAFSNRAPNPVPRPTVADETNLFGGLQPPPRESPETSATIPSTILQPPVNPAVPVNTTEATNIRVFQIYPPVSNTTVPKYDSDPHYSNAYSNVAHSRALNWPAAGRKVPQPTAGRSTPPNYPTAFKLTGPNSNDNEDPNNQARFVATTEFRGVLPLPRHHEDYDPSSTPPDVDPEDPETLDQSLSDALQMLLRPYFNRSGTVKQDEAQRAESHIMKLVSQQPTTTTTRTTTTDTATATPTTDRTTFIPDKEYEADVELILAGEQHSMITSTINTASGAREVTDDLQLNQANSRPTHNSNWHVHEHSRQYHSEHPDLPNPFSATERSNAAPKSPHHHQHHHQHQQHSREFHLKNPHLPNPYATGQTDTLIDTRAGGVLTRSAPTDGCQFDCGNGKCIKSIEVCDGVNNCANRKDESDDQCKHLGYEVRLTGGEQVHMGRIEVKTLGKWGYVCDDKFGLRDADVVCKELGFKLGASEVRGNSYYPPTEVNFSYAMDEVDCAGNETALRQCNFKGWGVNNCGPDEVVGVVCKVPLMKCPNDFWLCSTSKECVPPAFVCDLIPDCADKSDESPEVCNSPILYRLEGGRTPQEGRLEIKYRNEWGTVCDDDFGVKEAQVVCNSLGYYGKPTIQKNIYGPGSGPIWLDQVACFGNETAIDKCSHWSWGDHNCNHTEDVGIKCTAGPRPHAPRGRAISGTGYNVEESGEDITLHDIRNLEDIGLFQAQLERSSKFKDTERHCGRFKSDLVDEYEHPEERVVNGTIAKRGRHPWQATIRTRGRGGISSHWCGAVLISKRHLLTAAHCLSGYSKGAYFVRMGDHYVNIAESSETDSYIENWYIHEKFRDGAHMNNDIALIVLKQPVRFNDYIQPICLPPKNAPLPQNRICSISGWGSIKSGVSTPSNILRSAQVPLLSDEVCKQPHVYGNTMTEGMFCAGFMDESVDACDGDSGGPLVCSENGGETLYGIISWGQHCGFINKPGVYVRVEKYIDWIYEKVNISIQQSKG